MHSKFPAHDKIPLGTLWFTTKKKNIPVPLICTEMCCEYVPLQSNGSESVSKGISSEYLLNVNLKIY